MSKKQNLTKVFAKNKSVESTDHEDDLPDETSTEVWSQNSYEGSGCKVKKHNFQDVWNAEFSWHIYDSSNEVMYCDVSKQAGPDIASKIEIANGKKNLNVKVLFIKNQRLSRACIVHLVIKKNNWSYVKTMSCVILELRST